MWELFLTVAGCSGKDAVYDDAVEVYTTRLHSTLRISERWGVSASEVAKLSDKMAVVLLTEDGHMPKCSVAFSKFVYNILGESKSRAAFVIGADDGIPEALRKDGRMHKLSLGPLTLTHKMARLVLVEQLYRASTIRAGGKYHRV